MAGKASKDKPNRNETDITIRFEPEDKKKLIALAEKDERPLAWYVRKIVVAWLNENYDKKMKE